MFSIFHEGCALDKKVMYITIKNVLGCVDIFYGLYLVFCLYKTHAWKPDLRMKDNPFDFIAWLRPPFSPMQSVFPLKSVNKNFKGTSIFNCECHDILVYSKNKEKSGNSECTFFYVLPLMVSTTF